MTESFDAAQICLNGHQINSTVKGNPVKNADFCKICGAKTITVCEHCETPIRGSLIGDGVSGPYYVPDYCHHCGKPYPWTEAKSNAAIDMARILGHREIEALLRERISDLIVETPQTKVVAVKLQQLVKQIPGDARIPFRELLTEILAKSATKIIYPDTK